MKSEEKKNNGGDNRFGEKWENILGKNVIGRRKVGEKRGKKVNKTDLGK